MKTDIKVNGYPVVMSVHLVTEPGEGCKGSRYIATCYTMEELNQVLRETTVPEYWCIEVDFQDAVDELGCPIA